MKLCCHLSHGNRAHNCSDAAGRVTAGALLQADGGSVMSGMLAPEERVLKVSTSLRQEKGKLRRFVLIC
jgi:hypothetical protein